MKEEYKKWIDKNVPWEQRQVYGTCEKYSKLMKAEFPGLILVKGFFVNNLDEPFQHWWLKDEEGKVIDPTVHQFLFKGTYREVVGEEPIGKCMNCGDLIYASRYDSRYFCSSRCHDEGMDYLNNPNKYPKGVRTW